MGKAERDVAPPGRGESLCRSVYGVTQAWSPEMSQGLIPRQGLRDQGVPPGCRRVQAGEAQESGRAPAWDTAAPPEPPRAKGPVQASPSRESLPRPLWMRLARYAHDGGIIPSLWEAESPSHLQRRVVPLTSVNTSPPFQFSSA